MHAISFQAKRLHLSAVAYGRKVLEDVPLRGERASPFRDARRRDVEGMTPARYDFLYAIRCASWWLNKANDGLSERMSEVRKRLGLHHATVSKMAKRLAAMGWIRMRPDFYDKRHVLIELTFHGLKAIRKAMQIVYWKRTHLFMFSSFLYMAGDPAAPPAPPKQGERPKSPVWRYWETLMRLCEHFGDSSDLLYLFDWKPEGFDVPTPEGWEKYHRQDRQRAIDETKRLVEEGFDGAWVSKSGRVYL